MPYKIVDKIVSKNNNSLTNTINYIQFRLK